jgi:site-specific DNA-methyltransferase (adenine-specific)
MNPVIIGNATLYNADCRDVLPMLTGVDAVITDPPYLLTSGGVSGLMTKGIFDPNVYNNNGCLFNIIKFSDWMGLINEVDIDFYAMVNDKNMRDALNAANDAGFKLHNILVWDRVNQTPNRWYMKRCEFILYFWKGRARNINNMSESALFKTHCNMGNRFHPSEKPIELMNIMIKNSTNENEVVCDPFMGSGSTGVSTIRSNRKFIGIEIDNKYFDIACKRIEEKQRQEQMFYDNY